ncbi:thiamine-monophosphate kinase [Candidatus Photodesmus blepharus]|uniref:Thiamine-monophosphate kinase n=1 Tax=Candidatus Photodesmus blepharonis TaxID=1179155 RepID=A0A084CP81_9GAMM|nr:thiamine-phosphate kinase [Candidatus Photodesmus blepharus]KEY91610.1 thiamine-monophosphate kinase [Candidatus Photodesmus blepharus]
MLRTELDLINRFFSGRQVQRKDVLLSLGDDCAVVKVPQGVRIAVSTDTLVGGTHFPLSANPAWVAHKALSSNISDLAAMGATPAWLSLALTIPKLDKIWLTAFSCSFFELADCFGMQLIGGDTTRGPLSITITVQGFLRENRILKRDGAKVGDWIYVTGNLGDSRAGLEVILNSRIYDNDPLAKELERRHYLSSPRVLVGQALLGLANAAVDISDGLISDLKNILKASCVGASVDVSLLPISQELVQFVGGSISTAQQYALSSGEEYELCFTVPEQEKSSIETKLVHCDVKVSCIGRIESIDTLNLHAKGESLNWKLNGYDHFKDNNG